MEIDIEFIKKVAKDRIGVEISDEQAKRAHEIVSEEYTEQEYYYGLKDYFIN